MTEGQHQDRDQLCRMLLKKRFVRPILRSMVSSDIDVAQMSIQVLNNLVHECKHINRV
jgi:hypothetical protein